MLVMDYNSPMYKPIKGYEGRYLISDKGEIKSIIFKKIKKLTPCINSQGYIESILIDKNGKRKNEKWHRLLAKTFITNPKNKRCVNHKNGIKTDNRLENIEWVTEKENSVHARDVLHIKPPNQKGVMPKWLTYRLRLNKRQIKKIKERLKNGEQGKIIANDYKVSDQTIYDIKNKRCWI